MKNKFTKTTLFLAIALATIFTTHHAARAQEVEHFILVVDDEAPPAALK